MTKKDIILIAAVLVLILLSLLLLPLFQTEGTYVVVRVDGEQVAQYSLKIDGEYPLNGGTNTLRIEGGRAYLSYASCPDHLCMNMGAIEKTGQTITCLPNRLTVTVYGGENPDIELIS